MDNTFELTSFQKDMYFEDQLFGGAVNNIGGYLDIPLEIQIPVFKKACALLATKLDVFQLAVFRENKKVFQKFLKPGPPPLDFHNFEKAEDPFPAAKEWIDQEFRRPFASYTNGLISCALLKLNDTRFLFFVKGHHIVMDGWSFSILARKILDIYKSMLDDPGFDGSTLTIPSFREAVYDHQNFLKSERYQEAKKFWLEKYRSFPEPLFDTGTKLKSTGFALLESRRRSFSFSPDKYAAIHTFVRSQKVTLFHFFLGIFYVYFTGIAGQKELSIGLPFHNRRSARLKQIVGPLLNISVFRFSLGRNISFRELVSMISLEVQKCYRYQRYPLRDLNHDLELVKKGRNRIYDLSFSYEPMNYKLTLDNKVISSNQLSNGYEQTLIHFTLCEYDPGQDIWLHMDYWKDLWSGEEAAFVLSRLEYLMKQILENPQKNISDYSLLFPGESQLIASFSEGTGFIPHYGSLIEMFERQAEHIPDQPALFYEGKRLTYGQLNSRANRLARYLKEQGVKPGDFIGLYTQKSPEMVIGILGIMKSGGAYVALDPQYPGKRLEFIMKDAQVSLILTLGSITNSIATQNHKILCLEGRNTDKELSRFSPENLPGGILPGNPVYVIYTSGSTGLPRGVVIEHGSAAAHLEGLSGILKINPEDRILQFGSFSFDASVEQLFLALCNGCESYLFDPGKTERSGCLDFIKKYKVTIAEVTPSYFAGIMREPGWEEKLRQSHLRMLHLGGEAFDEGVLDTWKQKKLFNGCRLFNSYGPTEATIASHLHEFTETSREVLIGRLNPGRKAYVVNREGRLAPLGVPGELCLGGIGLARGYLNHTSLTAEKFIRNPFSNDPSQKIYRTGDMVRLLADGNYAYLGRLDNQVKIRGLRIEPGEIEQALRRIPGISESAVVVRERGTEKILVGFYVSERDINPHELRGELDNHLPPSLIPGLFQRLEKIPLTPGGKTDKKALPQVSAEVTYLEPRNLIEKKLCEIWQELLQVRRVGIGDNFFALGGDSITSIQAVSRGKKEGLFFRERLLFEHQTIAELSPFVTTSPEAADSSPEATLLSDFPNTRLNREQWEKIQKENSDIKKIYIATPMQQGMLFHSFLEDRMVTYISHSGCRLDGEVDIPAFRKAWEYLLERYDILRTCFTGFDENSIHQLVRHHVSLPLQREDWCHLREREQRDSLEALKLEDKKQGFDFAKPPLMRIYLIRLKPDSWYFLWSHHHVLLDGWCVPILFMEFLQSYNSFRKKERPLLPPAPSYESYIHWLLDRDLDKAGTFWQTRVEDLSSPTPLVIDKPPGKKALKGMGKESLILGKKLNGKIARLARKHKCTLSVILQAAWAYLLHRYTADSDIVFGATVSGRPGELEDIDRMLGLFINTIPIRVKMTASLTIKDLLRNLHQENVRCNEYSYLPLWEIQKQRKNHRGSSLFETLIVVENYPIAEVLKNKSLEQASGIRLRDWHDEEETNYPLTLTAVSGEELHLSLGYRTDRFTPQAITGLLAQFRQILEGMPESEEDLEISQIPFPGDSEREAILNLCDQSRDFIPRNASLIEIFEKQVEASPQKSAVYYEGDRLTYRQLNQRANQLAHYLTETGVRPGDFVGLCTRKSLDMVTGILGIMKSGGAYVALNPGYPEKKLAFMLKDAELGLILSQKKFEKTLPGENRRILCLDEASCARELSKYSTENPSPATASADHPAYVIYTSGSTGVPKGVIIDQPSAAAHLQSINEVLMVNNTDRILQFASLSFDASVEQLFLALCYGGESYLFEPLKAEQSGCIDFIKSHHITIADLTPSYFAGMMGEENWAEKIKESSLRILNLGGEVFDKDVLDHWQREKLFEGCRLLNSYGPTETTITSHIHEFDEESEDVVIGKLLKGRKGFVLDKEGRVVPCGAKGELLLGGIGLAGGYFKRPELTSEKFILNPFSPDRSEKIYRTGDLVRLYSDGNYDYLGRIDQQVKIRGLRIELGEIEQALCRIPGVRASAVVLREKEKEKYLAGYYVSEKELGADLIRRELGKYLPENIIPGLYQRLDKLPLTPNGKLDKRALPELSSSPALEAEFIPPRDKLEKELAAIWRDVLNRERIGIDDDFFALGGDSLKALALHNRMSRQKVSLSLSDLFYFKTIRQLADHLRIKNTQEKKRINSAEIPDFLAKSFPEDSFSLHHFSVGKKEGETEKVTVLFNPSQGKDPGIEQILDKMSGNVTAESFPAYIRKNKPDLPPGSEPVTPETFRNIMELKPVRENTIKKISEQLQSDYKKNNEILAWGPFREYPLNPAQEMQVLFIQFKDATYIPFNHYVHFPLMKKAVQLLRQEQPMLRSVPLKKNNRHYWRERLGEIKGSPDLSFIDLSEYHSLDESLPRFEEILSRTLIFPLEKLLYQFILIRKKLTENIIVFVASHVIYDRVSLEIIQRRLPEIYNRLLAKREVKTEEVSFLSYLDQVHKGPGLTQAEIIKRFQLREFFESKQKIISAFASKKVDFSSFFQVAVPVAGTMLTDCSLGAALGIYVKSMARILKVPHVPVLFVNEARNFEGRGFYNIIGEFNDFMPIIIDAGMSAREMQDYVNELLSLAKRNNICFLNLINNPDFAEEWKSVRDYYDPGHEYAHFDICMFNYMGNVMGTDSCNENYDPSITRMPNPLPHNSLYNCITDNYTDGMVYNLHGSYQMDIPEVRKIFSETAREL